MFRPKRLLRAIFLSVLSNYEQWKQLWNANGMEILQISLAFCTALQSPQECAAAAALHLHSAN